MGFVKRRKQPHLFRAGARFAPPVQEAEEPKSRKSPRPLKVPLADAAGVNPFSVSVAVSLPKASKKPARKSASR